MHNNFKIHWQWTMSKYIACKACTNRDNSSSFVLITQTKILKGIRSITKLAIPLSYWQLSKKIVNHNKLALTSRRWTVPTLQQRTRRDCVINRIRDMTGPARLPRDQKPTRNQTCEGGGRRGQQVERKTGGYLAWLQQIDKLLINLACLTSCFLSGLRFEWQRSCSRRYGY